MLSVIRSTHLILDPPINNVSFCPFDIISPSDCTRSSVTPSTQPRPHTMTNPPRSHSDRRIPNHSELIGFSARMSPHVTMPSTPLPLSVISLTLRALVSEFRCKTASKVASYIAQMLALHGHRNLTDLCSCHRRALYWIARSQHYPAAWLWV